GVLQQFVPLAGRQIVQTRRVVPAQADELVDEGLLEMSRRIFDGMNVRIAAVHGHTSFPYYCALEFGISEFARPFQILNSYFLILLVRVGHEAVTHAADRLEVAWASRLVFEIPPQPDDEVVDRARVGVLAYAPHLLEDRLARHGPAFVLHEIAEQ